MLFVLRMQDLLLVFFFAEFEVFHEKLEITKVINDLLKHRLLMYRTYLINAFRLTIYGTAY